MTIRPGFADLAELAPGVYSAANLNAPSGDDCLTLIVRDDGRMTWGDAGGTPAEDPDGRQEWFTADDLSTDDDEVPTVRADAMFPQIEEIARVEVDGTDYVVYSDGHFTWAVDALDFDGVIEEYRASGYSEWCADHPSGTGDVLCGRIAHEAGLDGIHQGGTGVWSDAAPFAPPECPMCRAPAHATETDDHGFHPGCRVRLLDAAREQFSSDEVAVDDDAKVAPTEHGSWVAAWVFVPHDADDADGWSHIQSLLDGDEVAS